MGLDGAVAGGVGHAGQHEAGFDLVVVQEALVGLIHGASGDLAGSRLVVATERESWDRTERRMHAVLLAGTLAAVIAAVLLCLLLVRQAFVHMAREARRLGFGEGIALASTGLLSEGAGENLFLVFKDPDGNVLAIGEGQLP